MPLGEGPIAITHTFLQEWKKFYHEFVNSNNYYCYVTLQHKTAAIDTTNKDEIAQPWSNHQPPMTVAMQRTLSQPCPSLKQLITSIQMLPLPVTQFHHNFHPHATVLQLFICL